MPPKRVPKGKLHELAVELPFKTVISDLSTKKQYCVGRQFATGGFGRIYTCTEVGSNTELVVKVEPYGNGPLFNEMNVFIRILKPEQIAQFMKSRKLKRLGVPPMISSGVYTHGHEKLRFLVIPKYAISLEAIRKKSKTLAASDAWTVARCMLESLEYIHEKNYTHADIKAANIVLERAGDFSSSVLVDFGLARLAVSNEDKPDKKRAHNGTAIFTSCDAHRGCHPSYRGDLEILAYNLIYWLSGSLPWEEFETNPGKVYEMKQAFLKDLHSNLKKLLKNSSESVTPLQEIFSLASITGYADQLNFSKLYKIVDDTMKRVATGGRKRAAEQPADVIEVKKTKAKSLEKATSTSKALIGQHEQESSNVDVKEKETSTPRAVRFRRKVDTISSTTAIVATRQSPRIANTAADPAAVESPSSSPQKPARHSPNGVARERRRAANNVRSTNKHLTVSGKGSTRLASGKIVPGLQVRRAPCAPLNAPSTTSTKISESRTPGEKRSPEKVSSDVKRSPTKLRKIPGMLNFQRGRRSIVIDQITKKYQRIAQKKRSAHHVESDQ